MAQRALNRRRLLAVGLVAPVLLFILFGFVAPVVSMLYRSIYNPTVGQLDSRHPGPPAVVGRPGHP